MTVVARGLEAPSGPNDTPIKLENYWVELMRSWLLPPLLLLTDCLGDSSREHTFLPGQLRSYALLLLLVGERQPKLSARRKMSYHGTLVMVKNYVLKKDTISSDNSYFIILLYQINIPVKLPNFGEGIRKTLINVL